VCRRLGYPGLKPDHEKTVRSFGNGWDVPNGQFECQQDRSRVSLLLKEVFLSRIVVSWRSEPPGKTDLCNEMSQDGIIVCHSSSTLYMMSCITFLQALRHMFLQLRGTKTEWPVHQTNFSHVAKKGLERRLRNDLGSRLSKDYHRAGIRP